MTDIEIIAEKIIQDLKYAQEDDETEKVKIVKDCLEYYLGDDGK